MSDLSEFTGDPAIEELFQTICDQADQMIENEEAIYREEAERLSSSEYLKELTQSMREEYQSRCWPYQMYLSYAKKRIERERERLRDSFIQRRHTILQQKEQSRAKLLMWARQKQEQCSA